MKIKLNGNIIDIENQITLETLIQSQNINFKNFIIEKNLEIIKKENYQNTFLNEGDSIEIVTLCAGG